MDAVRSMLLALATRSKEARLRWHAERAAARARGENLARLDSFASSAQADLCLLAAISAAKLPTGFKFYDVTLSHDPHTAATQLDEIAYAYHPSPAIEAANEAARLAYKTAYADPLTEPERHLRDVLAALPAARRDKIVELAEQLARAEQDGHHTRSVPAPDVVAHPTGAGGDDSGTAVAVGVTWSPGWVRLPGVGGPYPAFVADVLDPQGRPVARFDAAAVVRIAADCDALAARVGQAAGVTRLRLRGGMLLQIDRAGTPAESATIVAADPDGYYHLDGWAWEPADEPTPDRRLT